mmetsp:Transcript_8076/g.14607  ORF Transcript_8076/g.14607 Transcript_8076/m.14607 type:complete len:82 (+) Transcript_8076:1129-1374(+)
MNASLLLRHRHAVQPCVRLVQKVDDDAGHAVHPSSRALPRLNTRLVHQSNARAGVRLVQKMDALHSQYEKDEDVLAKNEEN